ncbi:penicillin acylase family protein [Intrasporangium sp.]|uniref:penicillin acylase family protein n=1 Tax=Intrasporangium sp. TaxID=1925024 RepID=UPI00293B3638|nr:penicillin acylase family protein [Intrasporangium sp.]MDV3220201.1 penicillin acylase family protein [Intrasporangium sp.]
MTGQVRRDSHGIPHLTAPTVLDLARLQGQVTAEDRAWQLEWFRWRMEGRTAEYIGEEGLPWDRFARQVRLEPTVQACYERLDDETRAWVSAYVDGVNDRLATGLHRAQELRLLGLDDYSAGPRPWEPWTPLGIFWAVHLLFGTFPAKLFNDHVVHRLGADWLPLFHAEGVTQSGSNAWAVTGERTASGLPLIGGDPHRTIEVPGCYQQVGLACSDFDVVGFAFPGVPGVQHFAHAGSVAWGITNAMADYQDLTREQLRRRSDGTLEALGVDGWGPATCTLDTVVVRGAEPVEVPVVTTERGPVVTGLEKGLDAALEPSAEVPESPGPDCFSLRTPAQVTLDLGFDAFLPLLRSRTVDDVEAALSRWVEPVNSAVVADTSGAVRHLVVGRVAERAAVNLEVPVDAWDPRHEWTGWRQGAATPVEEVLVSANDRASGGGLGVEYASPFRAARIRELLGERRGLTADDFLAIHVDTLNGQAALMRELVSAAGVSGAAAGVRDALLAWDGLSLPHSRGAAVFAEWRSALVQWLAEHPALAPLHEPTGHSRLFTTWLTVPLQVGIGWHAMVHGAAGHGIDVAAGVAEALERVSRQGDTVTVWGDRHWFDPVHALDGLGGLPTAPDAPVPGDKGCVLAAGSAPGVTDRCYIGPVARYVWDLADRDASRWVVPMGSSGIAGDDHFADQLPLWLNGGSLPTVPAPVRE